MFRTLVTVVAVTGAIALIAPVSVAAAPLVGGQAGSVPTSANSCSNPRLAVNATGWSATGGSGSRRAVTGHASAQYAFVVTSYSSGPRITLPPQPVVAGQRRTFAFDSRMSGGGSVRAAVDWYASSGTRLAHVDGAITPVGATGWTRIAAVATAPAGAVRAVISGVAQSRFGAVWSSTACDYSVAATTPTTTAPTTVPRTTVPPTTVPPTTVRPTTVPPTTVPPTTVPPTTPVQPTTLPPTGTTAPTTVAPTTAPTTVAPTTTVPPPADGTQAATVLGWGARVDGDEFEGAAIDTAKWGLYNSPGHAGKGLRRPAQISVRDGVLTIAGTSDGTTGGMAMEQGRHYGRWETRMRVPKGDARYHPVVILWPDAEDFPVGGEIDYAETTTAALDVDFFLHYSAENRTTHAAKVVDLTQWHNYAVEWTATGVLGYVDGVQYFSDPDDSHSPPRAMHQTLQLDWFPNGTTATTPSRMDVAWVRIYQAP